MKQIYIIALIGIILLGCAKKAAPIDTKNNTSEVVTTTEVVPVPPPLFTMDEVDSIIVNAEEGNDRDYGTMYYDYQIVFQEEDNGILNIDDIIYKESTTGIVTKYRSRTGGSNIGRFTNPENILYAYLAFYKGYAIALVGKEYVGTRPGTRPITVKDRPNSIDKKIVYIRDIKIHKLSEKIKNTAMWAGDHGWIVIDDTYLYKEVYGYFALLSSDTTVEKILQRPSDTSLELYDAIGDFELATRKKNVVLAYDVVLAYKINFDTNKLEQIDRQQYDVQVYMVGGFVD